MASRPPSNTPPSEPPSGMPHDRGAGERGAGSGIPTGPQVLVVAERRDRRESLQRTVEQDALDCLCVESSEEALRRLNATGPEGRSSIEVVVLDLARCGSAALGFVRELGDRQIATVIVCPNVSFDEAVEAMRAGASDIIPATTKPRELLRRVRSALMQHRAVAGSGSGSGGTGGVGPASLTSLPSLPKPAAASLPPMGGPIEELRTLLTGELDVEQLLRHMLEFVLAQIGPTNAAIFLPSTSGDYSLGAYVNYSCPKDTVEVLLDHLANVAAPSLDHAIGVLHLRDPESVEQHIGEYSQWLMDQHVIAFACRAKTECLAVVMLFRDPASPFPSHAPMLLGEAREVFATQLARVVRIHHRHLPPEKWGTLGDPPESDDQGGLAA
jgi:CheY-like chemotaxis protein